MLIFQQNNLSFIHGFKIGSPLWQKKIFTVLWFFLRTWRTIDTLPDCLLFFHHEVNKSIKYTQLGALLKRGPWKLTSKLADAWTKNWQIQVLSKIYKCCWQKVT